MSQYTGKPFHTKRLFFQQHNGIAKVQPSQPVQRSLGAKPCLFVGTRGFGSAVYLAFNFWIQLITRPRLKGAIHINIGLHFSLKGQHGWCRWWGYIHEEQCGYRRCSAITRTSEMGGNIDLNPFSSWPSLLLATLNFPPPNLPAVFPNNTWDILSEAVSLPRSIKWNLHLSQRGYEKIMLGLKLFLFTVP